MTPLEIRAAVIDDTHAISRLFCERVPVWQRLNAAGHVEEPPYEALSVYERWLHGGPWMSVETGAMFLSHLITRNIVSLVAQQGDHIVGYAEAYPGEEPAPYDDNLHIAQLIGQSDTVKDALLDNLIQLAAQNNQRLTVSFSSYSTDEAAYYQNRGLTLLEQVQHYTLRAASGQSFYRATEHPPSHYDQIRGWYMTIGRQQSARQHWVNLWPRLWEAIPEITARKTHRLHFSAAGQEAFVCCQQQLYTPRNADIYCWSLKPLSSQLLIAIRDWAYRADYRTLVFAVPERTARLLGSDCETSPYRQDIYTLLPDNQS
ncbi:MAG: hypothetical protein ACOCX5_03165 [Chloroflexota bacterium]